MRFDARPGHQTSYGPLIKNPGSLTAFIFS